MDFDLRDSLLIIGPLFIIAVLLHGYWRMRAGQNQLKMSLDKSFMSSSGERFSEQEEIDMLRAELPSGRARVRRDPEQVRLDLDEEVPVLIDPVDEADDLPRIVPGEDRSPPVAARPAVDDTRADESVYHQRETNAEAMADADDEVHEAVDDVREPDPDANASRPASARSEREPAADHSRADGSAPGRGTEKASDVRRPEHFVVLYVVAIDEPFDGASLQVCLDEQHLMFGEMNIFHRHDVDGHPLFSLVNAVEPGTFDPPTMATMSTPAISLFMRAHEQDEPLAVYEEMLNVARTIADELGGDVKDETRSVLSPQTIQHCRETLRDYQLKYR